MSLQIEPSEFTELSTVAYIDRSDAIEYIDKLSCAEKQIGWQLAYAVRAAVDQFGQSMYEEIAIQTGRNEKTLRNMVSATRSALAKEAHDRGLGIYAWLAMVGAANHNLERGIDMIATAAEQSLSVRQIGALAHGNGVVFPTSGNGTVTTEHYESVPKLPIALSASELFAMHKVASFECPLDPIAAVDTIIEKMGVYNAKVFFDELSARLVSY